MNTIYTQPKSSEWGPLFWYVIHTTALNYPSNPTDFHKTAYKNFFESFANVLPCKKCREHYQTHISRYPISPFLDSNELLNKWIIDLHNMVNQSLGKRQYTYQEVYQIYSNLKPINPFSKIQEYEAEITKQRYITGQRNKHYGMIFILALIIVGLLYLKKKYYYVF
jgi:hypothetical protein